MIDPRQPAYSDTPASEQRPAFDYTLRRPDDQPQVTVVTPFFNTGTVFHETARCVLHQSFQQWEWLIINDGTSQPESLAILEEYRHRDPRIRVIDHPRNQGLSAARNTGFREARTPCVFQLDSDDLIEPTTIEKCAWFLESFPEYAFVKGYTVGFGSQEYLWCKGFHLAAQFLEHNLATATAMIRRNVHSQAGGYDEAIRGGMEDWDFWLRCAAQGFWGSTIPEYLDWYRRRDSHGADWANLNEGPRQIAFHQALRQKYPALFSGGFPAGIPDSPRSFSGLRDDLPFENRLDKRRPRLLMIVPWLTLGGADKFNLDLVGQLTARGWEITIVGTLRGESPWLPQFSRLTPDVFLLHHFLKPADQPLFLRYLIESRDPDVVMVTNSELGYLLLPYLRACCPKPAYVDYCHMEQEHWKNGGYPQFAVSRQPLLDLNIVSSEHLKNWMTRRGADPERIEVCRTNVDSDYWRPDPAQREAVRRQYRLEPDETVILYAVRLCAQKKPQVFRQVMHELARRGLKFRALVAGDGEERAALESYLRSQRLLDRVLILGAVSPQRVRELMAGTDIFFLPSEWEGIAVSIYEAMSMGLAVVGTDVGGQRELVTPETGVLIAPGTDETEIQAYVREMTRLIQEPPARRRRGQRARERVREHFPLAGMGERMVELFGQAVRLAADSPRTAVPLALGRECAVQALELIRLDYPLPADASTETQTTPAPQPMTPEQAFGRDLLIQSELDYIEHSGSWQMIQRLKRLALYRAIARIHYGPGWDLQDPHENTAQRLARIKNSRAYRLIQAVKRTPMHRWYAKRRYGTKTAENG